MFNSDAEMYVYIYQLSGGKTESNSVFITLEQLSRKIKSQEASKRKQFVQDYE